MNYTQTIPRLRTCEDSQLSFVKRSCKGSFLDKRKFVKEKDEESRERGIFLLKTDVAKELSTPAIRRAFWRKMGEMAMTWCLDDVDELIVDLRKVDDLFNSALQKDTEDYVFEMFRQTEMHKRRHDRDYVPPPPRGLIANLASMNEIKVNKNNDDDTVDVAVAKSTIDDLFSRWKMIRNFVRRDKLRETDVPGTKAFSSQ